MPNRNYKFEKRQKELAKKKKKEEKKQRRLARNQCEEENGTDSNGQEPSGGE
ncbi:hypothetical protein [Pseudodesulfovibrio tunisiensis]|uniref:hypothetical protein n=1 Tax=Pseudodesulfovibrio tunisiensis TaxID=463192 RepID=UPI001FB2CB64|nr:hypothetical protein [Pseudodesulfovibrio tunisiensis]